MQIRAPRREPDRAQKKRRVVEEYGKGASVFSDPLSLSRLLGLGEAECREILDELVAEGFLQRTMMNEVAIYYRENDAEEGADRAEGD